MSIIKRITSAGLSLAMAATIIPSSFAVSTKSASTLSSVTAKYLDAENGKEIAEKQTYSVTHEEKSSQTITNYTYTDYTESIEYIYSHKDLTYIIGYPDKGVHPNGDLTRAEAAMIFYRLYDGDYPSFTRRMSNGTFKDVNAKNWFYEPVETLYNIGLLEGKSKDSFAPNAPISRAEFAVLAARFQNLKYTSGKVFSDVEKGHWAYSYINAASEAGWIQGYPDGTFRPDKEITRTETVTLVNSMINRTVTREKLKALNVRNPYNDLAESFWGYTDLMEATVSHTAEEWHDAKYNDGKYNIIVEKFVDTNGKEIAKSVTTAGKAETAPKSIPAYEYRGYIRTITYLYSTGDALPSIEKTASVKDAKVGEEITYTIKLSNDKKASSAWKSVVLTDRIPSGMTFIEGSVYVNNVAATHTVKNGTLTVNLGDIAAGKTVTVTFKAKINGDMYNQTIYNTAVAKGTNGYVTATDGKAKPQIDKSANKSSARVGDKIAYTLTVKNDDTATVPVENGVITDVLPAGLTFEYGSVTLNGKNTNDYTYDENTRLLTVNVGTIEPDAKQIIGFTATVNEAAYNTTIQNLATLTSDNADPVQDKDDGVVIADGDALLTVSKSADKTTAKVGDTITYTVNAANATGADVNIRDAVMTDTIPDGLTFRGNVTVDGYSAEYQYDNTGKTLTVSLGEIAPNQTKAICFDVTVNSDAYGMHIENTALVSGSNTPDKSGTDNGVDIEDGKTDGHAGNKTANKTTAAVGDTITYSIRLSNGAAATADWENMKVIDVLPDGVSFAGNVQENGSATVNYSYNADTKTITFTPDAIAAGAQTVLSFDVTVDDGSQGKFIVNTAILDDNGKETPMPDGGVQIDEGEAAPIVNKSASVTTANVGDTFTYTITAKNGNKATAAWKNVVMTDTLPTGVKLVGGVYVNNEFALYHLSGNALSVLVGDLEPGESAEITFDVQVLENAAGTTITNTASLDGDNGHGTATDKGVTIPDTAEQPDVNTNFYVTKEVYKTVVNVGSGVSADRKRATFTITVGNDSNQTWKRVILKDTLDTTLVTPVLKNNVYVDGVLNSKWSFRNKVFTLELGDIAPNEKRVVKITVEFKTDAGGKTYTNLATATGDNGSASGRSPEIEVVSSGSSGKPVLTDIHYQLFGGYADGLWRPNDRVSLQEACTVVYRLIANGGNTWLPRGTTTVPKYQYDIPEEAKYFVSIGVLPASAFDTARMDEGDDYEINYTISKNGYLRIWAASGQLNSLVSYATKANIGLSGDVSRLTFAKAICQITGRDTSPDVSGYSGNLRTWADAPSSVVTEVSHEHDFIMDSDRNEYWI